MSPMETNNTAIYWLIITASISSIIRALLYLFQRCCGQYWGNIHNVCFQNFAASLELRGEGALAGKQHVIVVI